MRLGIYKKVIMLTIMMSVVFMLAISSYSMRRYATFLNHVFDERSEDVLSNIALNLEYPMLIRDRESVERFIKGALAQNHVVFSSVEDADGVIMAQAGSTGITPVKEFSRPIILKKQALENSEDLILGQAQEKEEVIGRVTVVLSLSEFESEKRNMRNASLAAFFITSGLASLSIYIALKRILGRPIRELVSATERVSRGDLDYKVPVATKDELGALASSFNMMTEALVNYKKKLLDANEELVRKEKLATIGKIAGVVGHEIRNPIGVISNAVFFLKTVLENADETVKEYLDIIKAEVSNTERIISDLLDFARTRTPQKSRIMIGQLLATCVEKSGIPENVNAELGLPEIAINADPLQMRQVFVNLIRNAVDAMPGGGTIRICAESSPGFVDIMVSDTGEGIAPGNMARLFQPLFTTKAKGLGLGLTIIRNLTETNGGSVSVESSPGKGTAFTVRMPVDGSSAAESALKGGAG